MRLFQNLKALLNRSNLISLLSLVMALHMISVPYQVILILNSGGPSWLGIDDSWALTLNYAIQHHWTWGDQMIYVYGPLGFLATRVGLGLSWWGLLVFDVFIVTHFYLFFRKLIGRFQDLFPAVMLCFMLTLLIMPIMWGGLGWVILLFMAYWMHQYTETQNVRGLQIAAMLSTLSFFIKLNSGLIAIPVLLLFIALMIYRKQLSWRNAWLTLITLVLMMWFWSRWLHIDLLAYFSSGLELIRGINAVMYLLEDHPQWQLAIHLHFVISLVLLCVYAVYLIRKKDPVPLFFNLLAMLILFLLHKQSTFRNDTQHLLEYFAYSSLPLILMGIFIAPGLQRIYTRLTVVLTLFMLFLTVESIPLQLLLSNRYGILPQYFSEMAAFSEEPYTNQQDKRYIPPRILKQLATHSVDVIPWDAAYAIENKLNYAPRPVFQSFLACTPNLQDRNYQAYVDHAPEFILFDYDDIDSRYPFNEEPWLNLYILNNYAVADTFTSNGRLRLVLKRNSTKVPEPIATQEFDQAFTDPIPIRESDLVSIRIKPTWKEKFKGLCYKPTPVSLKITRADGQCDTFRTSRELLEAGLVTTQFVKHIFNYRELLEAVEPAHDIVTLQILAEPGSYVDQLSVTTYHFALNRQRNSTRNFWPVHFPRAGTIDYQGVPSIPVWGGRIDSRPLAVPPGNYMLSFSVTGTAAGGEAPLVDIQYNNQPLQQIKADKDRMTYQIPVHVENDSVRISFAILNDFSDPQTHEDRNAFISVLKLTPAPKGN